MEVAITYSVIQCPKNIYKVLMALVQSSFNDVFNYFIYMVMSMPNMVTRQILMAPLKGIDPRPTVHQVNTDS